MQNKNGKSTKFMPKPTPKLKIQFIPHQKQSNSKSNRSRSASQRVTRSMSNIRQSQNGSINKSNNASPSKFANGMRMDYKNYQKQRPSTSGVTSKHSKSVSRRQSIQKLSKLQQANLNISDLFKHIRLSHKGQETPTKVTERQIDNKLFYQIVYERTSVILPKDQQINSKQKEEKMFAEKCRQLLSRKRTPPPLTNPYQNKLSNNLIYHKMGTYAHTKPVQEDNIRRVQADLIDGEFSSEQLGKILKMQIKQQKNREKKDSQTKMESGSDQKEASLANLDSFDPEMQNTKREAKKQYDEEEQQQFYRLMAVNQKSKRSLSRNSNQYPDYEAPIPIPSPKHKKIDPDYQSSSPFRRIELDNGITIDISGMNGIGNGINLALPQNIKSMNNADKLQILGLIRSAEFKNGMMRSQSQTSNSKQGSTNNLNLDELNRLKRSKELKKTHVMLLNGITCYSLSLNQVFPTKRSVFTANATRNSRGSVSQGSRRVILSRAGSQRTMKFQANQDGDASYMKRLKSFLDFLFKINYSNGIYVPLQFVEATHDPEQSKPQNELDTLSPKYSLNSIFKYKVYVGPGNNCLLIKSLLKRRFWFEIVSSYDDPDISLVWTQNKVDSLHKRQQCFRKQQTPKINFTTQDGVIDKTKKRKSSTSPFKNQFLNRFTETQMEKLDLNRKILPACKSQKVQEYINKKGYIIPSYIEDVWRNYQKHEQPENQKNNGQKQKDRPFLVTNHLPGNSMIGSKKKLFKSLFQYYSYLQKDPFDYIPKTYHVYGKDDPEYKRFVAENKKNPQSIWIVKPGQNTNQGRGIRLATFQSVSTLIRGRCKHANGQPLTYIIQSYISKPFLYNGRKFDIRHYMLLTSINGNLKAYWYKEGYIRTSSQKYDIYDLNNQIIHLTNDAIQKHADTYQKYEPANKLSYFQFQRYLDTASQFKGNNYNFQKDIIPQMRSIITDVVKSNFRALDCKRNQNNFQIFGFDFMIDRNFKPWLIQINFNPCLTINCPLLNRVIPQMVQCSLRIAVDPLFPPKNHYPISKRFYLSDNYLKNLKYQLIFDELSLEKYRYQNHKGGQHKNDASEKIQSKNVSHKQKGYFYYEQPIKYADGIDQLQQQYGDEGKQVEDLIL